MKRLLSVLLAVLFLILFAGCSAREPSGLYFSDQPLRDSPAWVTSLDAADGTDQLIVVAGVGKSTAYITMHEKQDGVWKQIIATPGFIGLDGFGDANVNDCYTPVGTFTIDRAFGLADDPGCPMPYTKVDDDSYWSGDPRDGFRYNELVNLKELPGLDIESGDSEHIMDYTYHYRYCLNISYNEEGVPGLGSAIFLHCFGPVKPFTGGCVAIPEDHMVYVMQHVDEDTVVVIDTYEALSGGSAWPDSTWPGER